MFEEKLRVLTKMSTFNTITLFDCRALLECTARALLLAKPHNQVEFLCAYIDEMNEFADRESGNFGLMAYKFEEQWGRYSTISDTSI